MTDAEPPRPGRVERVLLFSLGPELFAVEGRLVKGVVPVEELTPVPRAPRPLLGVFAHRGAVLPLVDVRTTLGLVDGPRPTPVLTLLLEVASWAVGVAIDQVRGYERLAVEETGRPQGSSRSAELTWGWVERDGERFSLLDAEALLGAVRAT